MRLPIRLPSARTAASMLQMTRRTYMSDAHHEAVGGDEGLKKIMDEGSIKLNIQENARCEFTGTKIDPPKRPAPQMSLGRMLAEKVRQVVSGRQEHVFGTHPPSAGEVSSELAKGPLHFRSHNLAMGGSGYTGHHVFPVAREVTFDGVPHVVRADKDDTIFDDSRRDDVREGIRTKHPDVDANDMMKRITAINDYAAANKKPLQALTHDELVGLGAAKLLMHADKTEDFARKLQANNSDPIATRPSPKLFQYLPRSGSGEE